MVEVFYKPDFKVYIFKGDDMHNEELLAALDNSPTYSRTARELESIAAIASTTICKEVDAMSTEEQEDNIDFEQENNL